MTLGDNSLEIMLHPFNIHFFLSRPKIHYCSCDLGHRRPFPTITNLKSPPGKSFTPSMNIAPDQTIILGLQIILDHRSLSSIDHCNKFDKSLSSHWQTLCKTYSQWVSERLADWQGATMMGPGSKNILIASNPLPGQPWFPPPWVQAACPPRAPQQHLQGAPPSSGARPGQPARPSSWRWALPFVRCPVITESGGRLSIQVERCALWEVGTHEECDFSFKRLLNTVECSWGLMEDFVFGPIQETFIEPNKLVIWQTNSNKYMWSPFLFSDVWSSQSTCFMTSSENLTFCSRRRGRDEEGPTQIALVPSILTCHFLQEPNIYERPKNALLSLFSNWVTHICRHFFQSSLCF